jgi:hypothetical protein
MYTNNTSSPVAELSPIHTDQPDASLLAPPSSDPSHSEPTERTFSLFSFLIFSIASRKRAGKKKDLRVSIPTKSYTPAIQLPTTEAPKVPPVIPPPPPPTTTTRETDYRPPEAVVNVSTPSAGLFPNLLSGGLMDTETPSSTSFANWPGWGANTPKPSALIPSPITPDSSGLDSKNPLTPSIDLNFVK